MQQIDIKFSFIFLLYRFVRLKLLLSVAVLTLCLWMEGQSFGVEQIFWWLVRST